jgi:hypothetical protein
VHSFEQRARAILETATTAGSSNVTLICPPGGGLHVVMGEGSGNAVVAGLADPNSATYHVLRKGSTVFVTGRERGQTCALHASVASAIQPLLLSNQALYQLSPTHSLPAAAAEQH